MKKLLLILVLLGLTGCKESEMERCERDTFNYLNANFLDTEPPDTYTYRHLQTYVEGDKIVVVIEMTVATMRWTPEGMIPASQSWEQVFTYEIGNK